VLVWVFVAHIGNSRAGWGFCQWRRGDWLWWGWEKRGVFLGIFMTGIVLDLVLDLVLNLMLNIEDNPIQANPSRLIIKDYLTS
jgi:hypothetical protein